MRPSTPRILIVHNPCAGSPDRSLYDAVLARLREHGCRITIAETAGRGDATQLVGDPTEFDRIVAVGGDGTFNEVVNGVASVADAPPLAIIPEGTSNVLAAEIGLRYDPVRISEAILYGQPTPITLGRVNGHYFAAMMGAGLDAYVIAQVDHALKRRYGAKAYAASFFRQLREFSFPEYAVSVDGNTHVAGSVIVANASRYARSWKVAPGADIRSDRFDVCSIARRGRWGRFVQAAALFGGRIAHGRGLDITLGSRISISGPAGDPVQADGDVVTTLPAEVVVQPGAVRLLFPR